MNTAYCKVTVVELDVEPLLVSVPDPILVEKVGFDSNIGIDIQFYEEHIDEAFFYLLLYDG